MSQNTALERPDGRAAGIVLAVAAASILVPLSHHPVARGPSKVVLQTISALAGADMAVHGILIGLMLAVAYGLTVLSLRRGLRHPLVLAATLLLGLGTAAVIVAGMTDGFMIPAIARVYANAMAGRLDTALGLITFCALTVQVWTRLSLLASACATALWSLDFLQARAAPRWYAILGLVLAVVCIVAPFTVGQLTAASLPLLFAAQLLWYLVTGVLLARGDI